MIVVADTKDAHERSLCDEVESLRQLIGPSLPAFGRNQSAYEIQLRHRASQQEWVAAIKADHVRASDALESLRAQCGKVPKRDRCRIEFEPLDPRLEQLLESQQRHYEFELSDRGLAVAAECGLSVAALLPSHVTLIEQIAGDIPHHGWVLHLDRLPAPVLDQIRPMLEQLPRTQALAVLLGATKK